MWFSTCFAYVFGQSGTPLPGSNSQLAPTNNSGGPAIPLPGASSVYQTAGDANWGKPGQAANPAGVKSLYQYLPISAEDAKVKIDELKTLMLVTRPQDLLGRVNNMCEWLTDLTEAHNKLANVFFRQDSTKAMGQSEKSAAQRLTQLKNEAVLLKAELLIKLNRTPEALAPLVDIVIADPKGSVGQAAYRKLRELGFSPEAGESPGAISAANQEQEHIMIFPNTPSLPTKKGTVGATNPANKANQHPTR
jgi:hypothetical protein